MKPNDAVYEWLCPNCGERITSWSLPPTLTTHDPDCMLVDKNHRGPHHVRPGHPKTLPSSPEQKS